MQNSYEKAGDAELNALVCLYGIGIIVIIGRFNFDSPFLSYPPNDLKENWQQIDDVYYILYDKVRKHYDAMIDIKYI